MRMRKGDLYALQQQLKWEDDTPINLTDADHVNFVMIPYGSATPTVNRECVIDPAHGDIGYVNYQWQGPQAGPPVVAGETDVPGMYRYLFKIFWNSGEILTVPNGDALWLLILGD